MPSGKRSEDRPATRLTARPRPGAQATRPQPTRTQATRPPAQRPTRGFLPGLALLAIATLAVFASVRANDWSLTDDPYYVYQNPMVAHGLNAESARWAFRGPHGGNWHPLTSLAHLAAVSFFGLHPSGHHAVNWLLHAVNAVLVALVFQAYFGAGWRSLFVAALFAIHPLRVESVAWISELKDVLCGVFFLSSLLAYRWWVARPSRLRYVLLASAFALALMAKPMAVTLPVVLLLLDAWPLDRLRGRLSERLLEKVPLALLAVADAVLTVRAQHATGAVVSIDTVGLAARVTNAALTPWRYLAQTIWPARLAIFYPYTPISAGVFVLAAAGLALVTGLVWAQRRSRPYLAVGWLWYLVMLLPVVGILQVGNQAYADRYTYLPILGVLLAVVWGISDWAAPRPAARGAAIAVGCLALIALALTTRRQISYWRDNKTLYEHALAVAPDNATTRVLLGTTLVHEGSLQAAVHQFELALAMKPGWSYAEGNMGMALMRQGRAAEAIPYLERALRLLPNAVLHDQLGLAYAAVARLDEAEAQLREAVRLEPTSAYVLVDLAQVLAEKNRFPEAERLMDQALALEPNNEAARQVQAEIREFARRAAPQK